MVSAPALKVGGGKKGKRGLIFSVPWNRETLMPRNVFQETSSLLFPLLFRLFVLPPRSKHRGQDENFTVKYFSSVVGRYSIGRTRSKITSFPFLSTRMKLIAPDRSPAFFYHIRVFLMFENKRTRFRFIPSYC